jgi:glutamate-5-semialdehyde dehydrogenase
MTKHLSLPLPVRTVPSLAVAMVHINEHGLHHADFMIAGSTSAGSTFVYGVDSAGMFANASARFADGFRSGSAVPGSASARDGSTRGTGWPQGTRNL